MISTPEAEESTIAFRWTVHLIALGASWERSRQRYWVDGMDGEFRSTTCLSSADNTFCMNSGKSTREIEPYSETDAP